LSYSAAECPRFGFSCSTRSGASTSNKWLMKDIGTVRSVRAGFPGACFDEADEADPATAAVALLWALFATWLPPAAT